jgi:hypothetical protein
LEHRLAQRQAHFGDGSLYGTVYFLCAAGKRTSLLWNPKVLQSDEMIRYLLFGPRLILVHFYVNNLTNTFIPLPVRTDWNGTPIRELPG